MPIIFLIPFFVLLFLCSRLEVIPFDEFEKYKEILPYYKNVEKEGISIEWFVRLQNKECEK